MRFLLILCSLIISTVVCGAQETGVNRFLCAKAGSNLSETLSYIGSDIEKYLEGLKNGTMSFSVAIAPEAARQQLGYGPEFRATYGLLVQKGKKRLSTAGKLHITEVIDDLSKIVDEERQVRFRNYNTKYLLSIVYLRALESGRCSFPYVLKEVPSAEYMIGQLSDAYSGLSTNDQIVFKSAYDKTVDFGIKEIQGHGSVSIYSYIDVWRSSLLSY